MVEVKEMPYSKKLESILSFTDLVKDFASRLVQTELGKEKLNELQTLWQYESEKIPENASDKEKYDIAYRNFISYWVDSNKFMVKHKGDVGRAKFMHEAVAAWKRKYAGSAFAVKTVWALAPKNAFRSLAKRLAYELQVFSPFTVAELTDRQMILNVQHCKITDESNDFCVMACQNIIPAWLEAQFKVRMVSNRQGASCTVKFAPF